MREVKYRLTLQDKIVGYEWHKPLTMGDGHIEIFHSADNNEWHNIQSNTYMFIEHNGKDGITGLKDKNGREIYEGDIVDGYCSQGRVKLGAIEWQQSKLRFYAPPRRALSDADLFERMGIYEVIGNIHENPELLDKKGSV